MVSPFNLSFDVGEDRTPTQVPFGILMAGKITELIPIAALSPINTLPTIKN